MFDDDIDFKRLLPIAPAIVLDLKEEFRAKFEIVVKELKHYVLKKAKEKEEETRNINNCLNGVKNASDATSKNQLNAFYHRKKQVE
jgi:hypothetical protein